jgi:hypothetical protein
MKRQSARQSAFRKAQLFRRTVLAPIENLALDVLKVDSAVVAGGHASNREAFAKPHRRCVGLDIEAGPNVDLVVAEPNDWREVADASFDIVACSQVAGRWQAGGRQVFEHTEFFWITILEIGRVLKLGGLAFHRRAGRRPAAPLSCGLLAFLQ